jgi:hypothetical protein
MSLNFAQWGLADLDQYKSNTARNLSILRNLSLTGIANAIYDINDGTIALDSVWDEALIKSTYEGVGNPGPSDDTWRNCLVEAAKLLGSNGHAPLVQFTDPKLETERLDGRLDPLTASALVQIP